MTCTPVRSVFLLCGALLSLPGISGGAGAASVDVETKTSYLEWSSTGFEYPFWFDTKPDAEILFRNEPEYAGSSIVRTALFLGDGPDDFIGIALDTGNELLYVDANRNLDLTDDPGPFRGHSRFPAGIDFENVHVELEQNGIRIPYNLSMNIFVLDALAHISVRSSVHSGWTGSVEVGSQTFRMAVIATPDSMIGEEAPFFFEPDDTPSVVQPSPRPAPAMLVIDDHYWELSLALIAPREYDEPPLVQVDLAPVHPSMGTLIIDGMHVTGIVVDGPARIVVDNIEAIRLPVGTYRITDVLLEEGWSYRRDCQCCPPEVSISADAETIIRLGGPIREAITATTRGRYIHLSYTSEGAGGLEYEHANRSGPPQFVVMKGDKEIAASSFEYG